MSFELRVEFSGLCLYLFDTTKNKVMIVMPDCRRGYANPVHTDGTTGVHHAGYVRWDLAGAMGVPPLDDFGKGPKYEVVHRFDRESLDFGLPDASTEFPKFQMPDFVQFAPTLKPIPGIFDPVPPTEVLMRTVLSGGKLKALAAGKIWDLNMILGDAANPYSGQFAGSAMWKRTVDADVLRLSIVGFDKSDPMTAELRPVPTPNGPAVTLKVANLCANNPLEWAELEIREDVKVDNDFKWLYRLLRPVAAGAAADLGAMLGAEELPHPVMNMSSPGPEGHEDCMGGRITVQLP